MRLGLWADRWARRIAYCRWRVHQLRNEGLLLALTLSLRLKAEALSPRRAQFGKPSSRVDDPLPQVWTLSRAFHASALGLFWEGAGLLAVLFEAQEVPLV